jgi:D-alanyl-D-alanine carboxypeptidase
MKIPILPAVIIIIFILLYGSISLCAGVSPNSITYESNEEGRVLGVSEDIKIESIISNTFPKSDTIRFTRPVLKNNNQDISIAGCKGAVIDSDSDELLFEKESDKKVPIASITKLATALTVIDLKPNWDLFYEIKKGDMVVGGKNNIFTGEKIKIKDLLYLSLVSSDNTATYALVKSLGYQEEEFVNKMNSKMKELGLVNTSFKETVGLSGENMSTALEVAKLAKIALENQLIKDATLTRKYEFVTASGYKKSVFNTDKLLATFPQNGINIMGGKTGYTDLAGYCFVGKFIDKNGHEIITSVLGGADIDERFNETKDLVEWIFNNYLWPEI